MYPEVIIFGCSPFINQLDIQPLLERYYTIGINNFARYYPVDVVFSFDDRIPGHKARHAFVPNYLAKDGDIPYVGKSMDVPLLDWQTENGVICLGFKYFTVSLAVNWALLKGYKRIYLIGVDHVETDTSFTDFDGAFHPAELTQDAHRGLKEFIYRAAERCEIYQCNPAVRDSWKLPFKDVSDLYVKEEKTSG
jgi:hypothetical protein